MGYGSNRGKNRGHKSVGDGGGRRDSSRRRSGNRGTGYGGYRPFGGGSGASANRFAPAANAPVEAGKEYLVQIPELSQRGEGVAKIQGFVIFVPGAKPDPDLKVRIKIERVGPRFASASIVGTEGGHEGSEGSSEEENESKDDSGSIVEPI